MEFQVSDLGSAARIALVGRLDTLGVERIETRFSASIIPKARNTAIDLSGVTFLSSMGLRLLISTARSLSLKKAKLVLFGPQPLVKETLEHASIGAIIPIAVDEAHALQLLNA
jgi:anti-sigma B factor antagonist